VSSAASNSTQPPPSPFRAPASRREIRDQLEDMLIKDLLGPAGGEYEEIEEDRHVGDRYLVGMLAPKRQTLPPEQNDELALGIKGSSQDGQADVGAPGSAIPSLCPSSIGMTFSVDASAPGIRVTAKWGFYERVKSETAINPKTGGPAMVWKRRPISGTSKSIALTEGPIQPWIVDNEFPDVVVHGRMRRVGDCYLITLFLVNNQEEPERLRDSSWLFQPELSVDAPDGGTWFTRRATPRDGRFDPLTELEDRAMDMVYRDRVEFGVGHGVSVRAEGVTHAHPPRAMRVTTEVMPAYEVAKQTPPGPDEIPALRELELDMKALSELSAAQLRPKLEPLANAYAEWILQQRARVDDPAVGLDTHRQAAEEALAACDTARQRIVDGIALLESSPDAAKAFAFANRAMWLQRTRSIYAQERRRGQTVTPEQCDQPANRRWFPFQLAFVLLNLPSLADLHHPDRTDPVAATGDLLWFPTGGGKTEAYLGLAAFAMAIRRLRPLVGGHVGTDGVAVLMRYTLRLLTIQQFQRASALICACEFLRREAIAAGDASWGQTPFRIGLWVGYRTTPNTTAQSAEALRSDHGHWQGGSFGSPAQLKHCPWCGCEIRRGQGDIRVDPYPGGAARTLMFCSDPLGRCPFSAAKSPSEGIPAVVVDEEIYRRLPTLLIATVDKFAQMPWKGEVQTLFGRVSGLCPRHGFRSPDLEDSDRHPAAGGHPGTKTIEHPPLRPPDLIIQDELRLISGPLGSLMGLYETAVDELASWEFEGKRIRPKLIASTATIRRSHEQVRSLFQRKVAVFPPHGLDASDNFFARERPPSDEFPGRRYIGICAFGKRLKAALIRTYVALLAASQRLYDTPGSGYGVHADPWMTLVGYFNSLRELGGMRRLVDDDVASRLEDTDQRGLARRRKPFVEELTSRKASTEIPDTLDRLEVSFDPVEDARRLQARRAGQVVGPGPIDVMLATNMVSVGVDVKRLGLMVVSGQPKSTAEYIQATSRVGRSHAGLVVTVLNWARPRDLSHYERFEHFHATFYKHVEALSVTPFASRAIDRGVAALLVAMVRLGQTKYNTNLAAGQIDPSDPLFAQAIAKIRDRAAQVTGSEELGREVEESLKGLVNHWQARAADRSSGSRLGYQSERDDVTRGLLEKAGMGSRSPFTCLNSLRDVEPSVGLIMDDRELDVSVPEVPEGDDLDAEVQL